MNIDLRKSQKEDRFNQLKKHYEAKLHELITQSLNEIDENSPVEFINSVFDNHNKKWLRICAQSRQLDKIIRIDISAFKLEFTQKLVSKYNLK